MYTFYRGYVETDGKKSIEPFKNVPDAELSTLKQVKRADSYGGVLEENTIVIDIDDVEEAEIVMDVIEDKQIPCRVIETTRGMHFVFKNDNRQQSNATDAKSAIGVTVDIKCGHRNSYQVLKVDGEERFIIWDIMDDEEPASVPKWLLPVNTKLDFFNLEDGDGRNSALFGYILNLQSNDFTKDEAKETIKIINEYVLPDPMSESELETILRDESFAKPIFFNKNTFLFDKFAVFLKNNHHIKRINGQLHIFQDGIYLSGYQRIESAMIRHLPTLSRARRSEVLSYLEILVTENEQAEDSAWIAFRNGLYNIFTEEMVDFTPEHVITNKIPWDYNPNADNKDVDNTLNKMAVQDKKVRMLMEEMVGYTFYRRNELGKAFILTGEKSNGKSTFLDMIKTMLGDDNIAALDLSELGERFKTAELFGKLANIGDDIDNEYIKNTGVFKKLVTGDRLNVERKGLDPFDFSNYSKLLFSANSIPRLGRGKDSAAVARRLVIIPFNATFSKTDADFDPYIKYKLRQQGAIEYLIKLGVEGLKRVLMNNGFTMSKRVEKEISEYEIENNPVLGYFKLTDIEEVIGQASKDVYTDYHEYCLREGLTAMSNIQFSKEVNKYYQTEIVDKKIDNVKYRIFERI